VYVAVKEASLPSKYRPGTSLRKKLIHDKPYRGVSANYLLIILCKNASIRAAYAEWEERSVTLIIPIIYIVLKGECDETSLWKRFLNKHERTSKFPL